ncbi:MAG: DNA repair protein RecO [Candidatus Limnocylindrales bacterium]
MSAPRVYRTAAIVLTHFDLGEADRVVTLLTPRDGKLKAIAKGVRRPKSRLGGSVEPLAELDLVLARGRTFDVITQATVQHAWLALRDRLESTATAWYFSELVERSAEERAPAPRLYELLARGFQYLDAGLPPGRVARWFEFGLTDELGLRPEVDRCVECDRRLEAGEAFRWVPALGGLLCADHPLPMTERASLSADGLRLLKAYRHLPLEQIAGLRLPAAVEVEVEQAMRLFVRHVLEREARSLAFLDEVRATT